MPVIVEGREGSVCRPNLAGALVVKAAAHGNVGDADRRRHRHDFVALAGLLTAAEFAADDVTKTDRRRVRPAPLTPLIKSTGAEQRYQAVLAVIAEGDTIKSVADRSGRTLSGSS